MVVVNFREEMFGGKLQKIRVFSFTRLIEIKQVKYMSVFN
jgi:hypothetical protein